MEEGGQLGKSGWKRNRQRGEMRPEKPNTWQPRKSPFNIEGKMFKRQGQQQTPEK